MHHVDHPELWRQLYRLAGELYQQAPWEWMYDVDLFGVEDPRTGQIGYCGIMGANGEPPGIALFRGPSGLYSFERLIEQDPRGLQELEQYQLDCLLLNFRKRSDLKPEDLTHATTFAPDWPDNSVLPVVRDFTPGLLPWPIAEPDMIRQLLVAIEQALVLADHFRYDRDLLDFAGSPNNHLLVRVPVQQPEGLVWEDRWVPEPDRLPDTQPLTMNELFIRSNLGSLKTLNQEWLTDLFYVPLPIRGQGERPYLPQILLLVRKEPLRLISKHRFNPGELSQEMVQTVIKTARKAGGLPKTLITTRPETYHQWLPLAKALSLDIVMRSDTDELDEIKLQLFDSLPF